MNHSISPYQHNRPEKAADQKFCHSCGCVLHFSANSCTACGAVQTASVVPAFQAPLAAATTAGHTPLPANHVYCRGCGSGIHDSALSCPKCGAVQRSQTGSIASDKNRVTAAVLAFFLGGFGAHRFYLGHIITGLIYLVFCWTFIPAIIAFFEGIYFLMQSDSEFARKY